MRDVIYPNSSRIQSPAFNHGVHHTVQPLAVFEDVRLDYVVRSAGINTQGDMFHLRRDEDFPSYTYRDNSEVEARLGDVQPAQPNDPGWGCLGCSAAAFSQATRYANLCWLQTAVQLLRCFSILRWSNQWWMRQIRGDLTLGLGTTGEDIVVAVVDTGEDTPSET